VENVTPHRRRFYDRDQEQANLELAEMEQAAAAEKSSTSTGAKAKESLLRRKYVIPFVLAASSSPAISHRRQLHHRLQRNILLQSGLSDVQAHWGYVLFTVVNFLMTMRRPAGGPKGRKFLLSRQRWIIVSRFARAYCSAAPRNCVWILELPFNRW